MHFLYFLLYSVLVDFHNSLLELLDKALNSVEYQSIDVLKNLVKSLMSKEVSVLQIARDNTGVITLTEKDCLWIEQLSRASLILEEEYFPTTETQINFDFPYMQSYIIRTYLLFCRINYRHIANKYQCHVRRAVASTTTSVDETFDLGENYSVRLTQQQLDTEWNHLKEMLLDKLYHGHNVLRQISTTLKHHSNDRSQMNLYEFVELEAENSNFRQQLEQYEVKDFRLCYIDHVRQLYEKSIGGFQHLFTDIPHLLRVPIDDQLNNELHQIFESQLLHTDENDKVEGIKTTIDKITNLLNDLKKIEDNLLDQSTQPLALTCEYLAIENSILSFIPEGIKCENYVALNIQLIQQRSILQEKMITIEEKRTDLWNENFHVESSQQRKEENRFHAFLNPTNELPPDSSTSNTDDLLKWDDFVEPSPQPPTKPVFPLDELEYSVQPEPAVEQVVKYSSLFEISLKYVPLTTSKLVQSVRHQQQEDEMVPSTRGQKVTVTHPDSKTTSHIWKSEKLYEQLQKLFTDKKYDHDTFVVVDNYKIFIDFTNNDSKPPIPMPLEYHIIEKKLLFHVQFRFQTSIIKYFTTSNCDISTIINRLMIDNQFKITSPDVYLCFLDEFGKCIDGGTIADIYRTDDNTIVNITVKDEKNNTNTLCELCLRLEQGKNQKLVNFLLYFYLGQEYTSLFYPITTWQQIDSWLKTVVQGMDPSIDDCVYWDRQQKIIVGENQLISSATDQTVFDGISREETIKVTFSYETNSQVVQTLKSIPIYNLLNNECLLQQLNLKISPHDCVLVLGENKDQILSQNDIRRSVFDYSSVDGQPIHFQISILINIIKYDDQQQIKITISSRNLTVNELLQQTGIPIEVYKYLASNKTHQVIANDQNLSDSNETDFILVKENETCLISFEKSKGSQLIDIGEDNSILRFFIFATIADLYKQKKIDDKHQHLLYANDFVLSKDTQLTLFRSTSPICFSLIDDNLPVAVTISITEEERSITFHCSVSITVKRLHEIAWQLFDVNNIYYRLIFDDSALDDDDMSLDDIDSEKTDFQLKLNCFATLKSLITYGNQTVMLPCSETTLMSTLLQETFQKLNIIQEDINMYELFAMDNDHTQLELDTPVEDIVSLFSSEITKIPFELKKKDI